MSVENVPPSIDKGTISSEGTPATIVSAARKTNVRTALGVIADALTVTVHVGESKEDFSYLFSLPDDVISGSVGRILSRAKIANKSELAAPPGIAKLKGLKVTIRNKGGKLYWY